MFFYFLKSKPTLKELIPKGFVDIHSHILPGIDDGAKNIDEAIELISETEKLGFSKIIGTPHIYPSVHANTNDTILSSYNSLMTNEFKDIKVTYGAEYLIDGSLIKKIQKKELICLKKNYVLIELSYISAPIGLYEIIFELKHNGYIPILAHPERYRFFHQNLKNYYKLKKVGCLFQVNLLSTIGYYGKDILKVYNYLQKNKLIDFFGSDIHNINHINMFDKKVKISNINSFQEIIENNMLFI